MRPFDAAPLILMLVAVSASAEVTPEAVADRVERFYAEKPNISAEFTQKVRKPGRRRAMTKSGKVYFKRPGKMRWDYEKPEKVFYVSDGTTLWSYQPEDALVTKLDVRSSELYHQSRYLFGQGNLTQDFTVATGKADPDAPGLFPLDLKPKKTSKSFKSLTLYVDVTTGEIKQTVLVDPYDNRSTIAFGRTSNKERADKVFEFKPPASATVRDLSKKAPRAVK